MFILFYLLVKSSPAAPHKRAFAFVKYEDVESPQKAIEEEVRIITHISLSESLILFCM